MNRLHCNTIADIIALTIGNVQLYEQAVVARPGRETAHRGQMNFAGILFRFSLALGTQSPAVIPPFVADPVKRKRVSAYVRLAPREQCC